MGNLEALIPIGFVLFFGVVMLLASKMEAQRVARLREHAESQGYVYFGSAVAPGCMSFGSKNDYTPEASVIGDAIMTIFDGMSPFGIGHSRAIDALRVKALPWGTIHAFRYRYTTGSGKNQTRHVEYVAVMQLAVDMLDLSMRRQHTLDHVFGAIGLRDIQFESEEFNRLMYVQCSSAELAYQIIHPRMMEWLIASPVPSGFACRGSLMLWPNGGTPEQLDYLENWVPEFLDQFEDFVMKDRSEGLAVPANALGGVPIQPPMRLEMTRTRPK